MLGPQLPPPLVQFLLQPITAESRMAPCSHQKRLDFLIFDILSVFVVVSCQLSVVSEDNRALD